MSSNIVACFDNPSDARAVQEELIGAGFDRNAVHLVGERPAQSTTTTTQDDPGIWQSIKEAFGFADEQDRTTYAEAARRGGVIVSVDAPDNAMDQAVVIMRRHNAVDLDAREAQWRQQGWTGAAASASLLSQQQQQQRPTREGEAVIPVVEEELRVGKRQVQQGGVRVYSRVTERPVEEQVNLRQERVSVERRPVDRPINDPDRAFQERAIEAKEMGEEAVVDKQARVVEEVALRKDVEEQTETVRDTVRKTDVDIEQLPGQKGQARQRSDDQNRR